MTNIELRYMETVVANLPRIAKALERIADLVEKPKALLRIAEAVKTPPAPPVTTGYDPAMWICPLPPAPAASADPNSTSLGPSETP